MTKLEKSTTVVNSETLDINADTDITQKGKKKMTLEEEFKQLVEENRSAIEAKIAEATRALKEAMALSDKCGVPFNSSVSLLRQNYFPTTFDKFAKLDGDTLYELTETYYDGYGDGWEHSQVC